MSQLTILFDLDDTLIPTQEVYEQTKENALHYVYEKLEGSMEKEQILNYFDGIDKANVSEFGLSKERFPTSWVETFKALKSNGSTEKEEAELYAIASAVFESIIPPFPETVSVLNELKEKGYALSLLTAGDIGVQEKRIKDARLASYFENIYILPLKTPQTIRERLGKDQLEHAVMIGNSLRSDIYPSLELGMKAIHVERKTWGYDAFEVDKAHENYFSTSLQHVPQTIEKIEK